MTELTPEARALIEEVQEGDQPRPGAKEETWAALSARIAAGAAAGTAAGAASTATSAAGAKGIPLAAKVLIGTLTVGGVGVGAATFLSRGGDAPAPEARITPPPTPGPAAVAPAPAVEPEPEPKTESEPEVEPEAVEPPAEAEPEAPSVKRRPKKAKAEPLPDASSLMEEQTVLHAMRQARRGGDHAEVLQHARTYRQKFPRGQLRQDAEWLEIEALCELGKVDRGRKARDGFLERWPKSPHAGRVRGLCQ